MKFALSLVLVCFSFSAMAMELNLGACQSTAEQFILKGNSSDKFQGARQWDFKKFTRHFNDHEGGKCEKESFDQALKESKEYWNYIKGRYHCPQEGKKQCESVDLNIAYIHNMEEIYNGSSVVSDEENEKDNALIAENKKEKCQVNVDPAHKKVIDLHKNVFTIITHLPEVNSPVGICDHIPAQDRAKPNEQVNKVTLMKTVMTRCFIGKVKAMFASIKDLFTGLWDLLVLAKDLTVKYGSFIIDYLKAAWYGTTATFFAESAVQGVNFINKLAEDLKAIPDAIINAVSQQVADFKCMNLSAQAEMVCYAGKYIETEVAIAILTGGAGTGTKVASKAGQAVKLAEKSLALAKIEKKAAAGAKVVEFAQTAKKAEKLGGLKALLKEIGHKLDDFPQPSDFFKKGKTYGDDDLKAFMKKAGATDDVMGDAKKFRKWCARKGGMAFHPDRFSHYGRKDITDAAALEFKNFMAICDVLTAD